MTAITLVDLQKHLKRVIALNFQTNLWVKAEILKINFSRSHLYIELVEKGDENDHIVAQVNAVIWSNRFNQLFEKYGLTLRDMLQEGMQVSLLVQVEFHERFGLKLIVEDIDPAYTYGQLAASRQQTFLSLKKEGLLELNKGVRLPTLVKRIAVISSPTAAGYQDFIDQLTNNPYGFHFSVSLFPAAMQGTAAISEVSQQLTLIAQQRQRFDAVAVLRGGGARTDLAVFNNIDICRAAALCPLPLLTGIGHQIDESLLDLIAQEKLKTPTAVAEWLIARQLKNLDTLNGILKNIQYCHLDKLYIKNIRYSALYNRVYTATQSNWKQKETSLQQLANDIPQRARMKLRAAEVEINNLSRLLTILRLDNQLKRGFSVATHNGKIVRDPQQLSKGAQVKLLTEGGSITLVVD